MRKILDLDLKVFGLRIWITLHLLDLYWKSFGQRFIIILIRYFVDAGLGNTWATNLDYNYYILRDLDFKVPGLRFCFSIVIYLTGLGLELGLRIRITIVKLYWIWSWK